MKTLVILSRPTCIFLVLCACLSASMNAGGKRMLVVEFQQQWDMTAPFRLKSFKADFPLFTGDIVRRLQKRMQESKTLNLSVQTTTDTRLLKSLKQNNVYLLAEALRDTSYDYYLTGSVGNSGPIAIVNAGLYEKQDSTGSFVLAKRLYIEGTYDTASMLRRNLGEYLAADLVSQLEAYLDTSLIRVLVARFQGYGSSPEFKELGGMISSIIANRLIVSKRIRVITADTGVGMKAGGESSRFSGHTLPELGLREGAKYVISGSFFEHKNTMSIEAKHIDGETGHALLSKSLFIDSLTGRRLYDAMEGLGDEMRKAIELSDAIRHVRTPKTIAVVAVPPYPPTPENMMLSLEIVKTLTRRLKALAANQGTRPIFAVSSDQKMLENFVHVEMEPVIMARELNTQFLWIIRCERPQRNLRIASSWIDAESDSLHPARWFESPTDADTLNKILDTVFANMQSSLKAKLDGFDKRMPEVLQIRVPVRARSVAVVAAPPYPQTQDNRRISIALAQVLSKRLSAGLGVGGAKVLEVRSTEGVLDHFVEHEESVSPESLRVCLNTQYACVVRLDDLDNERSILLEVHNLSNPNDTIISVSGHCKHVDDLDATFQNMTNTLIGTWLGTPSTDAALLSRISFESFGKALRVRMLGLGFTEGSGGVYLGNNNQVGVQGSLIFYDSPRQFEISFLYNFGKRDTLSGIPFDIIGRYISGVVRWNFPVRQFLISDLRCYAGFGLTLINVEARSLHTRGSLVLGFPLVAGLEIPLSYSVFLDFGGGFTYSTSRLAGYDGNGVPTNGLNHFWEMSAGVGYRF